MRFGIDMNTDHTLRWANSLMLRVSVFVNQAKALRKLRHPTRSDHLRSFIDE